MRRGALTRGTTLALCAALLVAVCLIAAGCGSGREPVTISREALGTVVTVTAWGDDETSLRSGIKGAFDEMATVGSQLDAYDASSSIAVFNASVGGPRRELPPSAIEILDRIDALDVGTRFSPTLFGVTKLYGFGGSESVPDTATLRAATLSAGSFEREGDRARFGQLYGYFPGVTEALARTPAPGLDFGGAAKGLALDRAVARLRRTPGIRAVMISSVSSTVVWGEKPDGEKWRIGIEDPRASGSVLAVVSGEGTGTLNVSTSGDYQTYFERDGVRYHHILDPATGRPARGIRSLTVFGHMSGLDADLLSTALFVAGREKALEYAREHRAGVYLVDATGKAWSYVPPDLAGVSIDIERDPTH